MIRSRLPIIDGETVTLYIIQDHKFDPAAWSDEIRRAMKVLRDAGYLINVTGTDSAIHKYPITFMMGQLAREVLEASPLTYSSELNN